MSNKSIKDLEFNELEALIKKTRKEMDIVLFDQFSVFSKADIWLVYNNTQDQILGFAIQELIRLNKKEQEMIVLSPKLNNLIKINEELIDVRVYINLLMKEIIEDNEDIKELLELNNSI